MFSEKTILVTGAAGGIGSCLVQMLLEANAKVIAIDQDANGLSTLSNMIQNSENLMIIHSDLANETSAVEALKGIKALYGLVHLAGTFEPDDFIVKGEFEDVLLVFVPIATFPDESIRICSLTTLLEFLLLNVVAVAAVLLPVDID
mgnify:CR=1 FL=1